MSDSGVGVVGKVTPGPRRTTVQRIMHYGFSFLSPSPQLLDKKPRELQGLKSEVLKGAQATKGECRGQGWCWAVEGLHARLQSQMGSRCENFLIRRMESATVFGKLKQWQSGDEVFLLS